MFDIVAQSLKDKNKEELYQIIIDLNYKTTQAPQYLRPIIYRNLQLVTKGYNKRENNDNRKI